MGAVISITYVFSCDSPECDTEKAVERRVDSSIGLIVPLLPDGWTNRHHGPGEERQYCFIHSALSRERR